MCGKVLKKNGFEGKGSPKMIFNFESSYSITSNAQVTKEEILEE